MSETKTWEEAEEIWKGCKSFHELCKIQVQYIKNVLPFTLTYNGELDKNEVKNIKNYLIEINLNNFFTTWSQPGVTFSETNPYFNSTVCPQRATVQGWTTFERAQKLLTLGDKFHVCVYRSDSSGVAVPLCHSKNEKLCSIVVTKKTNTHQQTESTDLMDYSIMEPKNRIKNDLYSFSISGLTNFFYKTTLFW